MKKEELRTMFTWPQPQLMNEKKTPFSSRCGKIIIIVIVNHFYEELKKHVHQQRASNFLTTWVIKFYSFQANKTFHSRMQDTKTFLTFILCHAYTS